MKPPKFAAISRAESQTPEAAPKALASSKRLHLLALAVLVCVAKPVTAQAPTESAAKIKVGQLARLSLQFNKQVYVVGEPIVASLALSNTSLGELYSVFRMPGFFRINLIDAQGKPFRWNPPDGHVGITTGLLVPPAATATTAIDIVVGDVIEVHGDFQRAERFVPRPGELIGRVSDLAPGVYTATARQDAQATGSFEVREPNEQEKKALELFQTRPIGLDFLRRNIRLMERAATLPENEKERRTQLIEAGAKAREKVLKNWSATLAVYKTVYEQFAATPYAPYALYYSGRIQQAQENWPEAIATYERLLREQPEFPLKADALYYLAQCQAEAGQKDKARQTLATFKQSFPLHLVAPTVEYYGRSARNPRGPSRTRVEVLEQSLKDN